MSRKNILKTIKTTVLKCDTDTTASGYIYPKNVIKKALENDTIKERLASNVFFGAFEPYRGYLPLQDIAFVVEKFYWCKNELRSVISILDTPSGKMLCDIMDKVKFSVFGSGNIVTDKDSMLVEDYELDGVYVYEKGE